MNNAWLLDVLVDLKMFAISNNLPKVADQLTAAVDVAEIEIRENVSELACAPSRERVQSESKNL